MHRSSPRPVAACAVAATVLVTATAARAAVAIGSARALYAGGSEIATPVHGTLALYAAAGSNRILGQVGAATEFGSGNRLAVVGRGDGWLAVISPALGNGVLGYVAASDVRLSHDPYALEVDLSARRVTVWEQGRRRAGFRVAVGLPTSATPIGRFSITDKLRDYRSAVYGWGVLALSAHQERLRPGWRGGDRVAIHGGGAIGAAVSAGCLHASEAALRFLISRLPLGTQVVIHP